MKKTKIFSISLALVLVMFSIVYTVDVEATETGFKDIPTNHPHKSRIDDLVEYGVVAGYEDGFFRPDTKINRGQFALFISRALDLPMPTNTKPFKDVGKDAVVYEGVLKAQAAGIIKGYYDGRFKAGDLISRGDMAIMLDRAMQYKDENREKSILRYSDKNTIGQSALQSVMRVTFYKIMWAHSKNNFSPNTMGDRLSTVLSLHQLMEKRNLFKGSKVTLLPSPSEVDKLKTKKPSDLTLSDVEKAYGTYRIVERNDNFGKINGFQERNLWNQYISDIDFIQWEEYNLTPPKPEEWLKEALSSEGFLPGLMSETYGRYPNYEVVSVNGKPYLTSELLNASDTQKIYSWFVNDYGSLLPYPPSENGQFIIDLHFNKTDFATYRKDSVGLAEQTVLPYVKNGVLYVDIAKVFEDTPEVNVTNVSATFNGQTTQFSTLSSPVETKDGRLMVPIREVAQKIGLHTRTSTFKVEKIEIRNYTPTVDSDYPLWK